MPERALLIGWGMSTKTQLAVYERLYGALGRKAESVIPDTRAGLANPRAFVESSIPIAERLVERSERSLVVHLFSDNGFIGWAALLTALEEVEGGAAVRRAIRGVVFDSAPGLWNVRGRMDFARRFARGMTPGLSRSLGLGAREHLPLATSTLVGAFLAYQLAFPETVRTMLSSADGVRRLRPRCPHLFMFGEQDALVPPADVRAWVDRERQAGLEVEAVAFERARHVALWPSDPTRYRETLRTFLARLT